MQVPVINYYSFLTNVPGRGGRRGGRLVITKYFQHVPISLYYIFSWDEYYRVSLHNYLLN